VKITSITVFAKRNLRTIEALVIIFAIIGAAITLAIGGSVKSDTIRIVDVSGSSLPPYGELNSSSTLGFDDNYSKWIPSSSAQVNTTQRSLVVTGVFQSVSTWTSVSLFKNANINITSYPILTANVNLTSGVRYGVRFYAQYLNSTEYNVWWEGSPLDHRPGIGYESVRVNMQREALLATGHSVDSVNKVELYVEDPPFSPQSFQFTLSKLSFESESLGRVSNGQYRAIYYDLKNPPQSNSFFYLNTINLGVTTNASRGAVFSIYFFDGPTVYTSTTASGLVYNPLTSFSLYTFYPNTQQQIFPELLPTSNESIVFVANSGTLENVVINSANFVFLPTTPTPGVSQQELAVYYVYFIFFIFLLPVGLAILIFREFLSRSQVPKVAIIIVLFTGMMCRIALAITTAHVFDMNVLLSSIRGWFQFRNPLGALGPTLPFTFFLYWTAYSPYVLIQLAGFQDVQFLGHAAGVVEAFFVKLFPILMDVLTFFLLLRFRKSGAGFVWATFYFLNPLAIFVSSVWAQYAAATMAFTVWGVYWMSREKYARAALAFVVSGMIELVGFLPYVLLLTRTARMKLYKALLMCGLAIIPVFFYPPEAILIFRISLSLAGFISGQFSNPGSYTLLGNFPQLAILNKLKPLLLSQAIVLGAALVEMYRHRLNVENLVFFIALSSGFSLLFSNLLTSWVWLLPVCLLFATMKGKNDLGAFVLVFGTSMAFLEISYGFGSTYLILGNAGYPIQPPAFETISNGSRIFSIMATVLAVLLLLYLRYGSGQPARTLIRTSGVVLSTYLLLYFWLGVHLV